MRGSSGRAPRSSPSCSTRHRRRRAAAGAVDLGVQFRSQQARLGRGVSLLGGRLVEIVDVFLRDLRALEAQAALGVVDGVVGGDALGVEWVAGGEAGDELAALLGAV